MKSFISWILVILSVPIFLIVLTSVTVKFQLLDFNFWQKTFDKHDIYQNLSTAVKNSLEFQIGKQGAKISDIGIITDLITPTNTKEFVDKNLQNVLSYANGDSKQINVYLPVDKLPANMLTKSLLGINQQMTLQELLSKFSFQNYQDLNLQNITHLGLYAFDAFLVAALLLLIIFVYLIVLTDHGKRFTSLSASFLVSGALILILSKILDSLSIEISTNLLATTSVLKVVVGTIAPGVTKEITSIWQMIGIILMILSVGLFFLRKPQYNRPK